MAKKDSRTTEKVQYNLSTLGLAIASAESKRLPLS